jgi:hypothetical protein
MNSVQTLKDTVACSSGLHTPSAEEQSNPNPNPNPNPNHNSKVLHTTPPAAETWKFLDHGMVENQRNKLCLQVGHCSTADDAKVAADQPCSLESLCNGTNLQWASPRPPPPASLP